MVKRLSNISRLIKSAYQQNLAMPMHCSVAELPNRIIFERYSNVKLTTITLAALTDKFVQSATHTHHVCSFMFLL